MINFTSTPTPEGIRLSALCTDAITTEKSEVTKFLLNPYFFVPVNVILSLTAFSGNILILISLHKDSSIHPPSKLLLRCLSVTDLCVGLFSLPTYITNLMTIANGDWNICVITDGLAKTMNFVLCGESIIIMTAISVDRLLALLFRVRYRQIVTLKRVRIFVACSWICVFALTSTFMWYRRFFFIGGNVFMFLLLVTSTCCYTKIFFTLRQLQAQTQDRVHAQNPGTTDIRIARYKKTISNVLWIYSALLVCYLPYAILAAVMARTLGLRVSPSSAVIWNAALMPVFFNSSVNPLLYYWKITEVRQAVKATLKHINIFSLTKHNRRRNFIILYYIPLNNVSP